MKVEYYRERVARWDRRFYNTCVEISRWSSCLSRQIGAIIVRDNTIVSTGYNGPPRGVTHCSNRIKNDPFLHKLFREAGFIPVISGIPDTGHCPRTALGYKSGEGLHLCTATHAEQNAIVNAARLGISTNGTEIYMNCGIPCKECLKAIINAGIHTVVCENTTDWYDEMSKFLVVESGITTRRFYHLEGD